MSNHESISDELLYTYLDGELDNASRDSITQALQTDPGLCRRAERLQESKNLVQFAFANASPPTKIRPISANNRWFQLYGVAASFLVLALCFGAGILGYKTAPGYFQPMLAATQVATAADMNSKRVILHIGESDPERFAATLEYAEHALNARNGNDMVIEVVTNAGGIDLLRSDTSPYREKVTALLSQHPNIHFFACMNTLRNLERQGVKTNLIGEVHTGATAVDHIVNRVLEGWTYIKMDHIPAI